MHAFDSLGSSPSVPSGRNRARRRATPMVERMEARVLLAANVNEGGAQTARPAFEGVAVCLPAVGSTDFGQGTQASETQVMPASLGPTANGQSILSAADRAWLANRGLTGKGQIVAVIDSGIAYRHEALGTRLGLTGRVVGGFDFAENDADPNDDGPAGYHGTHVAGIVGGQDGGRSGIAPDVAFVALRVFDDQGTARPEWIESALRWVSDHRTAFAWPITTVNLSLGALGENAEQSLRSVLEDDLRRLRDEGVFVAVAAGNRFNAKSQVGVGYPASSVWVTPVAAVDSSGQLTGFSERRAGILAAPGELIRSTVPDFLTGSDGRNNDYWATSGTSMAAPQVAATTVLARQAWVRAGLGEPTVAQLEQALRAGADTRVDAVTGIEFAMLNPKRTIEWIEAQAGGTTTDDAGLQSVTAGVAASTRGFEGETGEAMNFASDFDDGSPLFRAPRVRIAQFPASGGSNSLSRTVQVGDGQSAMVPTFVIGTSTAASELETTSRPDSGAAEERMRAIDLVLSMLGRQGSR